MKKCYQCNNPPMYLVTEKQIPLCLSCFSKHSQLMQREIENNERMMNYASDQIAFSLGMPPMGPRFPPRAQPISISGVELTNIKVSNSVIGTINTGTVGEIDQTISALIQLGEPKIAEAIQKLSEAVITSNDLSNGQKNTLTEILNALSTEAATCQNRRKTSIVSMLLENGFKIITVANDISDICQQYWPVIVEFFK